MDDFRATKIEPLGAEHTYGNHAEHSNTREVVLRLTAHHDELRALQVFLMEIAPVSFSLSKIFNQNNLKSATCMAPGIIGVSGGRPRPTGNMVHFAVLVDKKSVIPRCTVGKNLATVCPFKLGFCEYTGKSNVCVLETKDDQLEFWMKSRKIQVPLVVVCLARSGDKGDSANIGIIARKPIFYHYLDKILTEAAISNHMNHLMTAKSTVKKYRLPGICAFNFLITKSLGGGGLSSLQIDRQGKSYAQLLLSMNISVPEAWLSHFDSRL